MGTFATLLYELREPLRHTMKVHFQGTSQKKVLIYI